MKPILVFIALIMAVKVSSQDKDDPIFKLKKEELILKVEKEIQKEYPDFKAKNFDRIKLSKNDQGVYHLFFSNAINYEPIGKAYYHSVGIKFILKNSRISFQQIHSSSKGVDAEFFFKSTAKIKAITDIIVEKIKQKEGVNWKISGDGRLDIKEQEDVYSIWWIEPLFEAHYTADKLTYQLKLESYGDIAPELEGAEKWQELEW